VYFRDLKVSNLLMTDVGCVKIGDYSIILCPIELRAAVFIWDSCSGHKFLMSPIVSSLLQ